MTDTAAPRASATQLLFIAGVLLAASYLATEFRNESLETLIQPLRAEPWGPAWKCSGIVLLGLYALSQRAWLVGLGLLLSAVGDVLLELDGLFVGGMAAFGLAHVCYSAAFIGIIRRDGLNRSGWPFLPPPSALRSGLRPDRPRWV
jgi:hypothetical protein